MLLCCNSVVNHQNQFRAPIRVFCVSSWPNLFISMVEPCIGQKNMCFKKCMLKANAHGRAPVCSLFTLLFNTQVLHYSVQLALNSPEGIQSWTTVT